MIHLTIKDHLPWLISAISIYVMWQVGNKNPRGWIIGLCNQVLWFLWQYEGRVWGLMPLWAVMCFIYARNYLRWRRS